MKTAITILAVSATLLASPVFARSHSHRQMRSQVRQSVNAGGAAGAVGHTAATHTGVNNQAGSGGAAGGMGR